MNELLAAYLHQLKTDAAHALIDYYPEKYPKRDCIQALNLLDTGEDGSDFLIDEIAGRLGVSAVTVYQELLKAAEIEAEEIADRVQKTRTAA